MNQIFDLVAGGTCFLLETNGVRVVLISSLASAPGSTIAFKVRAAAEQSDAAKVTPTFKVKVRSCRLDTTQNAPAFRIEGRFIDLSRAQRLTLLPGS